MSNGILILNKEKGITSNKAILNVKKALNLKKVGHIGTLDPDASGVLPILINEATKLSDILINKDKEYIATGIIGLKTDTYDISGNILEKKVVNELNFDVKKFINVLNNFIGEYDQTPPIYSAIKVNGKKLYEYARKNIEVKIESRKVKIYDLKLLDYYFKDDLFFYKVKLNVSKGFYIRSFTNDLALKLNNIGTLFDLIRTKAGNFCLINSYTLNDITNNNYKIIEIDEYFKDYEFINVNDYLKKLILNGIYLDERQIKTKNIFKVYYKNKLLAIYKPVEDNIYKYKPVIVLNEEIK